MRSGSGCRPEVDGRNHWPRSAERLLPAADPDALSSRVRRRVEGFRLSCGRDARRRQEADRVTEHIVRQVKPSSGIWPNGSTDRRSAAAHQSGANVVRWNVGRASSAQHEFLWQEGHTAQATRPTAGTMTGASCTDVDWIHAQVLPGRVIVGRKTAHGEGSRGRRTR